MRISTVCTRTARLVVRRIGDCRADAHRRHRAISFCAQRVGVIIFIRHGNRPTVWHLGVHPHRVRSRPSADPSSTKVEVHQALPRNVRRRHGAKGVSPSRPTPCQHRLPRQRAPFRATKAVTEIGPPCAITEPFCNFGAVPETRQLPNHIFVVVRLRIFARTACRVARRADTTLEATEEPPDTGAAGTGDGQS